MKNERKLFDRRLLLITFLALVLQYVQAAKEPTELKSEAVKIQDIVQNEPAFDGKMVVIDGKIDDECSPILEWRTLSS
jgi:hypothetical protein